MGSLFPQTVPGVPFFSFRAMQHWKAPSTVWFLGSFQFGCGVRSVHVRTRFRHKFFSQGRAKILFFSGQRGFGQLGDKVSNDRRPKGPTRNKDIRLFLASGAATRCWQWGFFPTLIAEIRFQRWPPRVAPCVNSRESFPALINWGSAANLWHVDYSSTIDDSNKIRSSVGIASNIYTPVGPLSFVVAQSLSKASTDETQTFNFQIGTSF